MNDPAPQTDEQTRNQNLEDATKDPQAAQDAAAGVAAEPKMKSEKECMSRKSRLLAFAFGVCVCVCGIC